MGFLFRKRRIKRELELLRKAIDAKRIEVAASESESHKASGKKWSYIQAQRQSDDGAAGGSAVSEYDGQADVFEMRRQQCLAELKAKELELTEMVVRERQLAAELGDGPITSSEVQSEGH